MPVEALLLPLRMPLFCSFEIIALVGCGIAEGTLFENDLKKAEDELVSLAEKINSMPTLR